MKSLIEVTAYPGLDYSRAAQIGRKTGSARLGCEGNARHCCDRAHANAWVGISIRADSIRFVLQWQQRAARKQLALYHLLSCGGNDHRRNHLRRSWDRYIRAARVTLDLEVHNRSRLLRLWWHLCGRLCLQSG